ncbi:MAG: DUF2071 domain-containing protein [Myxococcales bacterium]|jgi:hypothetical protein|nr:DUF2071 domain-containing protein [Myxococcales bacterium]
MTDREKTAEGSSLGGRREHALGVAILVNLAIHALAMLAMATLLLPAMPGGPTGDDLERARRIAEAPALFRLGWLPWHLCALADVWMAVALARSREVPRPAAYATLALTALAVAPDQAAQLAWVTRGVDLARAAAATGDVGPYLAFERPAFALTASWAAIAYTLGAIGWTACLRGSGAFSRGLARLSWVVWPWMLAVTVLPLLPPPLTLPARATAAGNAIGFVLLEVWLWWAAELVLGRVRPRGPWGRDAAWRSPVRGPVGAALDFVTNSRVLALALEPLPVTAMKSRIRDVVYVSYLLPADRARELVPEGLELDTLGEGGDLALFTFLSFRHHGFGFRFLGPLRRLSPPAVQTNWRVHVRDPRTGHRGIVFVTNAIDRLFPALGARLFTEGMPMHWLARARIDVEPSRAVTMEIDGGVGSGPHVSARLEVAAAGEPWPEPWSRAFADFDAFLAYCVPQDRAMSTQPWRRRTTRQEIHLGIDPASCVRLVGDVRSPEADAIAGGGPCVCFLAPEVDFTFEAERYDPWVTARRA